MNILFYMHHPAQFHLLKNVITELKKKHTVTILATKKDVLEDLLKDFGLEYINMLPNGRKNNKLAIAWGLLKQDYRLLKICLSKRPDLMVGTSTEIAHIGKLLNINSVFLNEDDVEAVPLVGKIAYPFAKHILVPDVCSTGKWEHKTIHYKGYHELAYLHPDHFVPDAGIVEKYTLAHEPFFLIRFAKFGAHHDVGIQGINDEIASNLIGMLQSHGRIIITSERELPEAFEPFRLAISPLDMHHVMAFAKMFIGDSQTMAAEAGVLGTPFVRFNDFVGRIGYLKDLEETYKLGYGIRSKESDRLYHTVQGLLEQQDLEQVFETRRQRMLTDKINVADYLVKFIESYPENVSKP